MNSLIKSAIICGMTEAIRLTRHGQSRGGKSALVQMDQAQVKVTVYKCTQLLDTHSGNGYFSHRWVVEGDRVLNPRETTEILPCSPTPVITGSWVQDEPCPRSLTMKKGTGRCHVLPAVAAPAAVAATVPVAVPEANDSAPIYAAREQAINDPDVVYSNEPATGRVAMDPLGAADEHAADEDATAESEETNSANPFDSSKFVLPAVAAPAAVAATVPVAVPEANVFAVGQAVRCRNLLKQQGKWLLGEVTGVSPLKVMPYEYNHAYSWDEVKALQGNAEDVEVGGFKFANIGKVPKLNDQVLVQVKDGKDDDKWRIGTVTVQPPVINLNRLRQEIFHHDGGFQVTFAKDSHFFRTHGFHTIVVDVEPTQIASIVAKVSQDDKQAAREAARVHAEEQADEEGAKKKEANQLADKIKYAPNKKALGVLEHKAQRLKMMDAFNARMLNFKKPEVGDTVKIQEGIWRYGGRTGIVTEIDGTLRVEFEDKDNTTGQTRMDYAYICSLGVQVVKIKEVEETAEPAVQGIAEALQNGDFSSMRPQ